MTYEEKLKKFEKTMDTWTPEEIQSHIEETTEYYAGDNINGLLGDFTWDKQHQYHWHVIGGDSDLKLSKRMKMGWRYAPVDVIERAGISMTAKRTKMDGSTVVLANHKSSKALLLRIPKELFELNQTIKERVRNSKSLVDVKG